MRLSRGSKVFLVGLAALAVVGVWGVRSLNAPAPQAAPPPEAVSVTVPEGTTATDLADLLGARQVIDSPLAFKVGVRFDERAERIQAGTYQLRRGMETDEVLAIVSQGPPVAPTFMVTIPEGLTVDQTLERIAEAGGYEPKELQSTLARIPLPEWVPKRLPRGADAYEGMLFPNTYEFRRDEDPQVVLTRMISESERIAAELRLPPGLDTYEAFSLASLIEREARLPAEQAQISAVLHNRLRQAMRLQVDASVLYALGEQKPQVTLDDLEVRSPWNTYRILGLPPTPIAAPGAGALEAAAMPARSGALFYVVVDPASGRHAFSTSYDQFLADKARAQQTG